MRGDYLMVLPLLFAPMLREVGSGDKRCSSGYSPRLKRGRTLYQGSPRPSHKVQNYRSS